MTRFLSKDFRKDPSLSQYGSIQKPSILFILAACFIALVIGGCSGMSDTTKRTGGGAAIGAAAGGIAGAIGGNTPLGLAVGAAAGAAGGYLYDRHEKSKENAYEEGYKEGQKKSQ
jgi:uncharacterized membrane protein